MRCARRLSSKATVTEGGSGDAEQQRDSLVSPQEDVRLLSKPAGQTVLGVFTVLHFSVKRPCACVCDGGRGGGGGIKFSQN